MNCTAENSPAALPHPAGERIVVGYGNRGRGDDGLGPHVVERLRRRLWGASGVGLVSVPFLAPEMAEDLAPAGEVIFVDATLERLPGGRCWTRIEPVQEASFCLTHSVSPGFLLNLIERLYQRRPEARLLSIQGDEFDHGSGLSLEAERRAREAVRELMEHLTKEE